MQNIKEFIYENWKNTVRFNTEDKPVYTDDLLLGLPKPYTVPCVADHFQELYYWDTYFANVGLILSGEIEQAKNNIEDMAFLIDKFGYIPNGSRINMTNRTQPPFFTQMVREVYEVTKDKEWLRKMYRAAEKEYDFFRRGRSTPSGLFRYSGHPEGRGRFVAAAEWQCKRVGLPMPEDEETMMEYAWCHYSFCESGWDCNSRFGLRAHKFNPVELNALMYNMTSNLAYFASELEDPMENCYMADSERIKMAVNELCYDGKMYCDYDFEKKEKSPIVSAAAFYPLTFGMATEEQAANMVKLLPKLEARYGITGTEKIEGGLGLQWDYPQGWACLQYMVVKGLENYGYTEDAKRISAKYCEVVEINYEKTGSLWEKYDVVEGTVAKDREHAGHLIKMMGWSAGVYLYCDSKR